MKTTISLFLAILFSLILGACSGDSGLDGQVFDSESDETSIGSGSGDQALNNCVVSGAVQTTVVEGTTIYTDIPNTALRIDSSRQYLDNNLSTALISGFGKSINGSLRWTGEVNLDSVVGQASGIPHSARVFYELDTGDINGLVLLPTNSATSGTIPVTLHSEYGGGRFRTRYGFGIRQNYVQTSSNIIMEWSYSRVTDKILFTGTGTLDLGETTPILGWKAYPTVSLCLSANLTP